jgi:hypothetical protein
MLLTWGAKILTRASMRAKCSGFGLLFLIAFGSLLGAQQISPDVPGSCSGVVLRQSTGKPLRRIALTLRGEGAEVGYHAISGEDGSFSFLGVPHGEYRLEAALWNVKGLGSGAGPMDRRRVQISAGTQLTGLVAQVTLPGLIRGKISYEDGTPAWARIALLASDGNLDEAAAESVTNSRGEYEIAAPGDGGYYVVAVPPLASRYVPFTPSRGRGLRLPARGYAHSFYPGVSYLRLASSVRITDDAEVEDIDISLRPVPLVTLRGKIVNSRTKRPMAGSLSLAAPAATWIFRSRAESTAVAGPDGAFTFINVPAGSYHLEGSGIEWAIEREIEFGPAPEQQLTLYCDPPTPIEGSVVMESATEGTFPRSLDFWEERSGRSIVIEADGKFSASATPGRHISLQLSDRANPGLYIRSAALDGRPVSRRDFTIPAARALARLEVRIGAGAGFITIEVTGGGEQPQVAVLPTSGDPLQGDLDLEQREDGRFRVRVPPGPATVLAWIGAAPCDLSKPSSCRGKGVSTVVKPGSAQTVHVQAVK